MDLNKCERPKMMRFGVNKLSGTHTLTSSIDDTSNSKVNYYYHYFSKKNLLTFVVKITFWICYLSSLIQQWKWKKTSPIQFWVQFEIKKNIPQKILDLVYDWLIRFRTIFTVKGRTIDWHQMYIVYIFKKCYSKMISEVRKHEP